MKQYLEVVQEVYEKGEDKEDRTGVGCRSLFGKSMRFSLEKEFPLLTAKRTFWKGTIAELFWMLSGSTNVNDLPSNVQHWWRPWALEDGSLGPTYGKQWRDFFGVDQLKECLERLSKDQNSRRHLVSLWNAAEVSQMQLPPCHASVLQFYVDTKNRLHSQMYQRSADLFLGVPVNIAFYALLTHLIANDLGYGVGDYIHVLGDTHLYKNHLEAAQELLCRSNIPSLPQLLKIELAKGELLSFVEKVAKKEVSWDEVYGKFQLEGYQPLESIKVEVAV